MKTALIVIAFVLVAVLSACSASVEPVPDVKPCDCTLGGVYESSETIRR